MGGWEVATPSKESRGAARPCRPGCHQVVCRGPETASGRQRHSGMIGSTGSDLVHYKGRGSRQRPAGLGIHSRGEERGQISRFLNGWNRGGRNGKCKHKANNSAGLLIIFHSRQCMYHCEHHRLYISLPEAVLRDAMFPLKMYMHACL